MKKRLIGLALAMLMAIPMAGCNTPAATEEPAAEPAADAAGLLSESSEAIESYSFGKLVKWGNLGQVLHEVPDSVLCDDALSHPMGPPPLLVEHGQL